MVPSLYFSEYFGISEEQMKFDEVLNINLIADTEVFIDPFLLFSSEKEDYKALHQRIIRYLKFLKQKSILRKQTRAELKTYYCKKEINQNWMGYSFMGNKGRGFGMDAAISLDQSFREYFSDLGDKKHYHDHFEKFCIYNPNIGVDTVSDFITNIIIDWLAKYTEELAIKYKIKEVQLFPIRFYNDEQKFVVKYFTLPCYKNDFVLLTPMDILAKDKLHIGFNNFYNNFGQLPYIIESDVLKTRIETFLAGIESEKDEGKKQKALLNFISREENYEIINLYINDRENQKEEAIDANKKAIEETEKIFYKAVSELYELLSSEYEKNKNATCIEVARALVNKYKEIIENRSLSTWLDGADKNTILKLFYLCSETLDKNFVFEHKNQNKKKYQGIRINGDGDSTFIEVHKSSSLSLDYHTNNGIYNSTNNTFNGVLVILSSTENEYKKTINTLNEFLLSKEEYEKIIFINDFDNPNISFGRVYRTNKYIQQPTVFISYQSYNTSLAKMLNNRLQILMRTDDIITHMDKQDLNYNENIDDFMKSITENDFSILIVSKKYLESEACMFEAFNAVSNDDYIKKVIFIIIDKKLYEIGSWSSIIKYWETKEKKLEASINELVEDAHKVVLREQFNRIKKIADFVPNFLERIKKYKNWDEMAILVDDTKEIIDYIRENKK